MAVFWSAVLFALFLVPIVIFFKTLLLRILTIPVVAIVVLFFGIQIWPYEPSSTKPSIATLAGFVGRHYQALQFSASWIIASFIVGAALAYLATRFQKNRFHNFNRSNTHPRAQPSSFDSEAPVVEVLRPLNLGNVGWHRVISGKVFPPDTPVQVLVQHPKGGWRTQPTEVNGSLWTSNSEFGEKNNPGGSYKIVAIHGRTLSGTYDDLDEGWIKSNIIMVNRNSDNNVIDCPDIRLHQTQVGDKNIIRKLVKVCFVRCESHLAVTGDERQFIDFRFCVLNLSLLSLSVDSVTGHITFTKPTYNETIKIDGTLKLENAEKAMDVGFRREAWFTVRQYVPDYQVTYIDTAPNESSFYFYNLKIGASVEGIERSLELDIPAPVQKGIIWNAQDVASEFVFANAAEREERIRELERTPSVEPTTLLILTALSFGARKVAGEASKDYYEKLKRLVKQRLASEPAVETTLASYEQDPNGNEERLKVLLNQSSVSSDAEILKAAQALLGQVSPHHVASSKYNIQITGDVRGFVPGDQTKVTMNFENPSEKD